MDADAMPESWAQTTLDAVAEIVAGNPAPQDTEAFQQGRVNFVRVQDMGRLDGAVYLRKSRDKLNTSAGEKLRLFKAGSVLFTKSGASTLNNQRAILAEDSYVVSHIGVAVPHDGVSSEWVYYALRQVDFANLAHSSVMPSLPLSKIKDIEIVLPPSTEQHRIVAKIEELFSELDQGVASLKTAREQLKVYRQSLLKNAFEGKLTAAWRAAHRDQLETAAALQQRIARERQARYQQQLADWQTAGQAGPKPKPPKPLPPLTAEELDDLPKLPAGWGWEQIAGISECLDSLRVPINKAERLKRQGEIPYYGANGQVGWIDDYLFDEPLILVVEDETFTGREKPFSYKVTGKSWVNNHAHILKPLAGIELDYLNYQLFFYPFTERTTGTTGRKKLTQEALMTSPVRVCSTLEQVEIVSQLESKLSEADQLDQTLATALQQADALRQSILKKAFCGQLVKQAKNEEPATALLERIRAEHLSGPGKKKTRLTAGATR